MRTVIRSMLPVLAVFLVAGCMSILYPSPTKECLRLRELFAKEVPVGMPEAELLSFCRIHNWKPSYNKYENRYVERIPVSKGDDGHFHSIMIDVWLTEDRKVKSFDIMDVYTGL